MSNVRSKYKNSAILFLLIMAILMTSDFIITILYYRIATNHLNKNDKQPEYNLGVLFFHGHNGRTGISNETRKRLDIALSINASNHFNAFICVGGLTKNKIYDGSNKMKQYLISHGIADSLIFIDTTSFDTYSNWASVEKICKRNNWVSATAISSPMHLYRIMRIAKKSGIKLSYSTFFEDYKKENVYEKWKDIQHELLAIFLHFILPNNTYSHLLKKYRKSDF